MPNIANIYYHSVAPQPNPDWILNHNTLLLRYFEDQMNYLTRNGYKTVHLDDIFIHQSIIGPKNVWLSFDDGYLDNWVYVYPIIRRLGIKITIFVTPEFVDPRDLRRPNLDDVWLNKVTMKDLPNAGFLSWREMREMEESGLVDIQSHTLTHTKWEISSDIEFFHNVFTDSLYPITNRQKALKPFYMETEGFNLQLPYGFPILKSASSVIAKKAIVNRDYEEKLIDALSPSPMDYKNNVTKAKSIHQNYHQMNAIIERYETDDEYQKRVYSELSDAKTIIENNLNKVVHYCCWPHGDANEFAFQTALNCGYKAVTRGKLKMADHPSLIGPRYSAHNYKKSRMLTQWRLIYKVNSLLKRPPFYQIKIGYNQIKKRL
jgi:hypothetical protein